MHRFNAKPRIATLAAGATLLFGLLAANTAKAGLDACGNFYVAADASCEWVPEEESCTTECEREGGALFCDGSYVSSGSVEDCVLAIKDEIHIDVEGWIEGGCVDPEGATDVLCEIEGGLSCSVADEAESTSRAALAFMGLGMFALAGLRRRRS